MRWSIIQSSLHCLIHLCTDRQLGAQIAASYLESFALPVTDAVTDNDFQINDGEVRCSQLVNDIKLTTGQLPIDIRGLKIVLPRKDDTLKRYEPRRMQRTFRLRDLQLDVVSTLTSGIVVLY